MSRTVALLLAGGLAAGLSSGLAGCLPDTRNRVARFLFDGVPPAQAQPEAEEQAAQPVPDPQREAPAPLPVLYTHAPYAAGDCAVCHDARSPGRMLKKVPELCLDCHTRADLVAVHGELGDCLACHDPHKAQAAFLLDFE
jgi:predicted CXXCH cytochrome family protein